MQQGWQSLLLLYKWGCTIKKLLIICVLVIAPALHVEAQAGVVFHGFSWGTKIQEFTARMGSPVYVDEYDDLQTLIYENIAVLGYSAFMLVYFSENGLEGGTYYFNTFSFDELTRCYINVQRQLLSLYGSSTVSTYQDETFREMRPYETIWDLPGGYVYLKVNTRENEPVTLWYSSPALTGRIKEE
jgi:hypothetical protein